MTDSGRRLVALASSAWGGYAVALVLPVLITVAIARLGWPAFVFEHLIVLLVVAVAVGWELRQAMVTAVVAVIADNVLLQEPNGQPGISGYRDLIDLVMFLVVALIVSWLVARTNRERLAALESEQRERRAREERDRLIATVTHDVATPLSVLRGTVQFARASGPKDAADLARLLVRLEIATARATSLISTLTDAQALDGDGLQLNLADHDLRELVTPIVQMMDRLSERHPVLLALPDRPVPVRCDADRLQRVVENLVNNAIKYSPDGGAVEVSVAPEDGATVLRVRDHGIGISAEARPRIFERSYRAPEAAAAAPGLGLGLSIAAHVVARHGGTIDTRPAEGAGTVVTVRLPLAARNGHAGAQD